MFSAKNILKAIGFTSVPQALEHIYPDENECAAWFGLIDFEEAVCFYGLNKHKVFMEKFKTYQSEIGNLFRNRFDVIKYLDCASISKFLFDCEAEQLVCQDNRESRNYQKIQIK